EEVFAAKRMQSGLIARPTVDSLGVDGEIALGVVFEVGENRQSVEIATVGFLAMPKMENRALEVTDAALDVRVKTLCPRLEVTTRFFAESIGLEEARAGEHRVRNVEVAVAEYVGVVKAMPLEDGSASSPGVAAMAMLEIATE